MNWNFDISGSPQTSGNNLVATLYDPSNPSSFPSAPVWSQAITSGFPGPFNLTATGLQAIVYNFILWETSGTTPGGAIRNNFSMQPTIQTLQVRTDLYLTAGGSAGFNAGTTGYVDPTNSLKGWTYSLEQIGYGTLQNGALNDYTTDSNNNPTLVNGATILPGQKWVFHFQPIVSNQPIQVASPNLITSYKLVTTSGSLSNADMGKLIAIQGSASAITITLPALSTVSDNTSLFFNSAGGSHINAVVQTFGSDNIQWKQYSNQTTAQVSMILGQSEQMLITKAAGIWNVLSVSSSILTVGEIFYSYSKNEMNALRCQGQVLNRADYPRLWNFINQLESQCLVSQSTWNASSGPTDGITFFPNKGKFHTGDGTTTFGIPDLRNYGFIRGVDGSARYPGDLQIGAMIDHSHPTLTGVIGSGPNGLGPVGTTGEYNGAASSKSDLTGGPYNRPGAGHDGSPISRLANEVRPDNNGAYLLIRI